MKYCSQCGEWKPLDEFYKDKTAKDGVNYWCKDCRKFRRYIYYRTSDKFRNYIKDYALAYQKEHRMVQKMKVWLDDVREMPEGFDFWAKTSDEVIRLIKTGKVSHISFDFDLGKDDSGYKVALFMEEYEARHKDNLQITCEIHSQNPVGVERLNAVFNAIATIRKNKIHGNLNVD